MDFSRKQTQKEHSDNYMESSLISTKGSRGSPAKIGIDSSNGENEGDTQESFLNFLHTIVKDDETTDLELDESYSEEESEDVSLNNLSIKPSWYYFDEKMDKNGHVCVIPNDKKSKKVDPFFSKSIDTNDGVFRASTNCVKANNYAHLSNRLSLEDPQRCFFFNEEGELKEDAPLVRYTLPINKFKKEIDAVDDNFIYAFAPAEVLNISSVILTRNIKIEVSTVNFKVHYLSSKANILIKKVLDLYKMVTEANDMARCEYYSSKISFLREELKKTKNSKTREKILEEIISLYGMKDAEEYKEREMRDELLDTWHRLKEIQEATFDCASFVLKWLANKKNETEKHLEIAEFEKELEERAEEIQELEKLKNEIEIDKNQIIEEIKEKRKKLGLREPGETDWKPILNKAEPSEDNEITKHEKERRSALKKLKIKAVLKVSKNPIHSPAATVTPDMKSVVRIGAKISCLTAPHYVTVEIWENGEFGNALDGTIRIPVVNGIPSSFETLEFTSEQPIGGCLIQGTVTARAYIEPDKYSCETVLKDDSNSNMMRKTLKDNPSMFINVPHFLENTLLHDPNDPHYQENLESANTRFDSQLKTGEFQLDKETDSTKFSSMAPPKVHDELQNRVFTKEKVQRREILKEDVIKEKKYSLWQMFKLFFSIFRRRRPLSVGYIQQEASPVVTLESVLTTAFSAAMNAPNRRNFALTEEGNKTFVFARVFFCGENAVTDIINPVEGEWREAVTFNIGEIFDLLPSVSEISQKVIRVDLFDHIYIEENDYEENRFLATLEIPIKGLIKNSGLDAAVPFASHPIMFGYNFSMIPITVDLTAAILPKLILPPLRNQYTDVEDGSIISRVEYLTNNFRCLAFGADSRNRKILLTRFVMPQNPPKSFNNKNSLIRFVSTIPFSTAPQDSECPLIHSTQEIIMNLSANYEEHAIILCNYLLYCNLDAYVVVGNDVVNGPTSFVYISSGELLDPITGRIWSVDDKICTLTDIGSVFNGENIWFNKQKNSEPWKISFDFKNEEYWTPLFESAPDILFNSIKPNSIKDIKYGAALDVLGKEVQDLVEFEIGGTVESLRGDKKTKWNKEACKELRELLAECEEAAMSGDNESLSEVMDDFSNKFPDFHIVGSPFCFVANSSKRSRQKLVSDIKEEIKMREVFFTAAPNAQFASAVFVKPYPNEIFAVWSIVISMVLFV